MKQNWKTTAIGVCGAVAYWLATYLQSGQFNLRDLVIGAAVAALGALAKDFNITGSGGKVSG